MRLASDKEWEIYVTGCQMLSCCCERTAPRPTLEPSVSTQKGSVAVGMERTRAVVTAAFRASKASWHTVVHSQSFFSEVSTFKGHTLAAKSHINI